MLIERGRRAADRLPAGLVYAGFSLGVLPAQLLAQTRPGARGALLFHSCVPPAEFGTGWPPGVPVQIHGMEDDPFFAGEGDLDAARELVKSAADEELFMSGRPASVRRPQPAVLRRGRGDAADRAVLAFLAA